MEDTQDSNEIGTPSMLETALKKKSKKKKKATDENSKSSILNSSIGSARTLSTSVIDK
jgi:hypothetical protein